MRSDWMRMGLALALAVWVGLPEVGTAGVLAQLRTVYGDLEVELFDQDKPRTVANFVRYVESGLWDDMFVHRLEPGFVLQGGGYTVAARGTTNAQAGALPRFPNIENEFAVGRRLSNVYGTIAMAKVGGDTNSANAEWFINLADNSFLDAANSNSLFTVFGQVVGGTNVLNTLNKFVLYSGAGTRATNVVMNFGAPYTRLPFARTNATFDDLLYVDVTLLKVQVAQVAGGAEISWSSVAGRTNRVEFSGAMPPVWETLVRTNGNGARLTVTDASPASASRFYRVRVEY